MVLVSRQSNKNKSFIMKKIILPLITTSVMGAMGLSTLSLQAAATVTDVWSSSGGSWTQSNQPDFSTVSPSAGGVLYSDTDIAAGTNNNADSSESTLGVSGADSGGVYSAYYYTLNSTPTFTANINETADDLGLITITIVGAMGATTVDANLLTLVFGSATFDTAGSFSAADAGDLGGFEATEYTWTYDVSGASPDTVDDFTVSWSLASHEAFATISVTQTIPEPSSVMLGTLGAASLLLRRRR